MTNPTRPRPTRLDFMHPTGFFYRSRDLSVESARIVIERTLPEISHTIQIAEWPGADLTQIELPPTTSLKESANVFRQLKAVIPGLMPDIKLIAPTNNGDKTMKGSEATSPTSIPGGGTAFKPETVQEEVNKSRFKNDAGDKLVNTHPEFKGRRPQFVDVVLIDSLPNVDIAAFAYNNNNPDLKQLVHDMQNDLLRFRPIRRAVPPLSTHFFKSPDSGLLTKSKLTISSHGLFSAGIIRKIAPGVRVTILEGLDEMGVGTLSWFLALLKVDLPNLITARKKENPNAVILLNLSLVCVWPVGADKEFHGHTLETFEKAIVDAFDPFMPASTDQKDMNIRIFGAAGNDGLKTANVPAYLPAALDNVIEVIAADAKGNKLPYSNGQDAKPTPPESMMNSFRELNAFGDTIASVFVDSLLPVAGKPDIQNTSGYVKWAGTSFATAITSGVVANLCWAGLTPAEAVQMVRDNPKALLE